MASDTRRAMRRACAERRRYACASRMSSSGRAVSGESVVCMGVLFIASSSPSSAEYVPPAGMYCMASCRRLPLTLRSLLLLGILPFDRLVRSSILCPALPVATVLVVLFSLPLALPAAQSLAQLVAHHDTSDGGKEERGQDTEDTENQHNADRAGFGDAHQQECAGAADLGDAKVNGQREDERDGQPEEIDRQHRPVREIHPHGVSDEIECPAGHEQIDQ